MDNPFIKNSKGPTLIWQQINTVKSLDDIQKMPNPVSDIVKGKDHTQKGKQNNQGKGLNSPISEKKKDVNVKIFPAFIKNKKEMEVYCNIKIGAIHLERAKIQTAQFFDKQKKIYVPINQFDKALCLSIKQKIQISIQAQQANQAKTYNFGQIFDKIEKVSTDNYEKVITMNSIGKLFRGLSFYAFQSDRDAKINYIIQQNLQLGKNVTFCNRVNQIQKQFRNFDKYLCKYIAENVNSENPIEIKRFIGEDQINLLKIYNSICKKGRPCFLKLISLRRQHRIYKEIAEQCYQITKKNLSQDIQINFAIQVINLLENILIQNTQFVNAQQFKEFFAPIIKFIVSTNLMNNKNQQIYYKLNNFLINLFTKRPFDIKKLTFQRIQVVSDYLFQQKKPNSLSQIKRIMSEIRWLKLKDNKIMKQKMQNFIKTSNQQNAHQDLQLNEIRALEAIMLINLTNSNQKLQYFKSDLIRTLCIFCPSSILFYNSNELPLFDLSLPFIARFNSSYINPYLPSFKQINQHLPTQYKFAFQSLNYTLILYLFDLLKKYADGFVFQNKQGVNSDWDFVQEQLFAFQRRKNKFVALIQHSEDPILQIVHIFCSTVANFVKQQSYFQQNKEKINQLEIKINLSEQIVNMIVYLVIPELIKLYKNSKKNSSQFDFTRLMKNIKQVIKSLTENHLIQNTSSIWQKKLKQYNFLQKTICQLCNLTQKSQDKQQCINFCAGNYSNWQQQIVENSNLKNVQILYSTISTAYQMNISVANKNTLIKNLLQSSSKAKFDDLALLLSSNDIPKDSQKNLIAFLEKMAQLINDHPLQIDFSEFDIEIINFVCKNSSVIIKKCMEIVIQQKNNDIYSEICISLILNCLQIVKDNQISSLSSNNSETLFEKTLSKNDKRNLIQQKQLLQKFFTLCIFEGDHKDKKSSNLLCVLLIMQYYQKLIVELDPVWIVNLLKSQIKKNLYENTVQSTKKLKKCIKLIQLIHYPHYISLKQDLDFVGEYLQSLSRIYDRTYTKLQDLLKQTLNICRFYLTLSKSQIYFSMLIKIMQLCILKIFKQIPIYLQKLAKQFFSVCSDYQSTIRLVIGLLWIYVTCHHQYANILNLAATQKMQTCVKILQIISQIYKFQFLIVQKKLILSDDSQVFVNSLKCTVLIESTLLLIETINLTITGEQTETIPIEKLKKIVEELKNGQLLSNQQQKYKLAMTEKIAKISIMISPLDRNSTKINYLNYNEIQVLIDMKSKITFQKCFVGLMEQLQSSNKIIEKSQKQPLKQKCYYLLYFFLNAMINDSSNEHIHKLYDNNFDSIAPQIQISLKNTINYLTNLTVQIQLSQKCWRAVLMKNLLILFPSQIKNFSMSRQKINKFLIASLQSIQNQPINLYSWVMLIHVNSCATFLHKTAQVQKSGHILRCLIVQMFSKYKQIWDSYLHSFQPGDIIARLEVSPVVSVSHQRKIIQMMESYHFHKIDNKSSSQSDSDSSSRAHKYEQFTFYNYFKVNMILGICCSLLNYLREDVIGWASLGNKEVVCKFSQELLQDYQSIKNAYFNSSSNNSASSSAQILKNLKTLQQAVKQYSMSRQANANQKYLNKIASNLLSSNSSIHSVGLIIPQKVVNKKGIISTDIWCNGIEQCLQTAGYAKNRKK